MAPFNYHDPKYHSCFCGAHVTKLARVFIVFDIVDFFITLKFLLIIPIAVIALGVYGVLREQRSALLWYIGLRIFSTFLWILAVVILASSNVKFNDPEYQSDLLIKTITFFIVIFIEIIFISTYWKLSEFLKDRDNAHVIPPIHYEYV